MGVLDAGMCGDKRFDDVELPEHGRGEDRDPGAMCEQDLGDFTTARMRCCAKRMMRLPAARAIFSASNCTACPSLRTTDGSPITLPCAAKRIFSRRRPKITILSCSPPPASAERA